MAAKKEMTKFGLHCAGFAHFIDKCPHHQKFLTAKRKHVEAIGTWDKNRPAVKRRQDEQSQGQGGSVQGNNNRQDDTNTVNG